MPHAPRLAAIALVGAGGFAGASLRYAIGLVVPGVAGTVLVNVIGSFLLGVVLYRAIATGTTGGRLRQVVATGFLASFTTYSAFALETVTAPELAVANVGGTYALGMLGVVAGGVVARRTTGGR